MDDSSSRPKPKPKALRFVPAFDGSARSKKQKKQRTTAACRTCRTRKTRCDGGRPVCSTCKENGHVCLGYAEPRQPLSSSEKKHNAVNSDLGNNGAKDQGFVSRGADPPPQRACEPRPPKRKFDELYEEDSRAPMISESPYRDNSTTFAVPYFRYFGPTAIVPGYKQMVVQVKEPRRVGDNLTTGSSPGSKVVTFPDVEAISSSIATIESALYDLAESSPIDPLIEHLVETFFLHLGCNFPFLQKDRFLPNLRQKMVEVILVDAICAIAARFSKHPLLIAAYQKSHEPSDVFQQSEAEYGQIFARRARSAIVDSFPCPTLASIQACLLLAHESFGAGQDSALWMMLGCAIRMTQDMGLQKLDGIMCPGPQSRVSPHVEMKDQSSSSATGPAPNHSREDLEDFETERINTFWSVLLLDRIISSGTGRPVTIRDEEIELPLPPHSVEETTGWPRPFPALIRMLHLYGRVSDLLNNIRSTKDVTPDMRQRLSAMENDLTRIYQALDPRLTFNVVNFQHYIEVGEGSNFVMVHFWFHTLIILLHQPTLLNAYGASIQEVLPNSRELSMSSAKTIADILAFAELVDSKSALSNPFTSQPIYVAACAFLKEIAAQTASQPPTRPGSPNGNGDEGMKQRLDSPSLSTASRNGLLGRHSLLASAAKQNYQGCYKALQQLEKYWAGIKYILTALNQKFEGIWDPETYTEEEMKNAIHHRTNSLASSGAARRVQLEQLRNDITNDEISTDDPSLSTGGTGNAGQRVRNASQMWTLSGNTNSKNANLTFLYKSTFSTPQRSASAGEQKSAHEEAQKSSIGHPTGTDGFPLEQSTEAVTHDALSSMTVQNPLNLPDEANTNHRVNFDMTTSNIAFGYHPNVRPGSDLFPHQHQQYQNPSLSFYDFLPLDSSSGGPSELLNLNTGLMGDMMIESQDIDMTPFGGEMFPLFLPQEFQGSGGFEEHDFDDLGVGEDRRGEGGN